MSSPFYILSIDGGGFRGVYPAYILSRIEEEFTANWSESIDLIAGTSTGSIIAAGVACGIRASRIVELYKKHGTSIFKRRWFRRLGLLGSRYRMNRLGSLLQETFGEQKLSDVKIPLIVPATDIGNGCVHVFKSAYDNGFVRDKKVLICDAILASCAAPTYFDPRTVGGKYHLADGGLWANNPALVAAIDAKRRFGRDFDDLRILSIGTGTARHFYPQKIPISNKLIGWGFATRWGRGRFIEMLLNLQTQNANNMLALLLRRDQILRLDFESDTRLPLDDPGSYKDLLSRADREFSHRADEVKRFFELSPGDE